MFGKAVLKYLWYATAEKRDVSTKKGPANLITSRDNDDLFSHAVCSDETHSNTPVLLLNSLMSNECTLSKHYNPLFSKNIHFIRLVPNILQYF